MLTYKVQKGQFPSIGILTLSLILALLSLEKKAGGSLTNPRSLSFVIYLPTYLNDSKLKEW